MYTGVGVLPRSGNLIISLKYLTWLVHITYTYYFSGHVKDNAVYGQ